MVSPRLLVVESASIKLQSPLILTPKDTDTFLEALNEALDAAKQP